MNEYVASAFVKAGELKVRNKATFEAAMKRFRDGDVIVTVERVHAIRSVEANAYYWGIIIRNLCEFTGYDPVPMHEYLKKRFNPRRMCIVNQQGEVVDDEQIGDTTTKLSKVKFYDYCEAIREWARQDVGLEIPAPDPDWRKSWRAA